MEAEQRLIDAAAHADRARAVAERAQLHPPAVDDDALGAVAFARDLPALGRRVDGARAGALLRRDVADERPELERRHDFGTDRDAGNLAHEYSMSSVLERQQHAGEIAQGAALDSPLAERAIGTSFEAYEDEILTSVQDLTEV